MKRRVPKTRVFLDVESASEMDLPSVGGIKYCEHASTFPRCLAYAVNGGAPQLWLPLQPVPEVFRRAENCEDTSEIGFYAYNADGFDLRFFELVLHARYNWPRIPDELWYDVQCDALACGLPAKLENACIAANVRQKKDILGGKVIYIPGMSRPNSKGPKKWLSPDTNPEEFKRLYTYCMQDVVAMRDLYLNLPMHVCEEEDQRAHFLDCLEMNRRGISIDKNTVEHIQARLESFKKFHTKRITYLSNGEIDSPTQRDRIKNLASSLLGKKLPNMQGAYLDKLIPRLSERGSEGEARELLQIYRDCSNTSTAKYTQMSRRICADGTIKNNFVFHGTGPGRYAARGVQVHNMPRPEKYFGPIAKDEARLEAAIADIWDLDYIDLDIMYGGFSNLAKNLIRSMLKAKEGHKFLCADFKSIEARAVPWHCKDEKLLSMINKGVDLYVLAAANMYHVPVSQVDGQMRQAGKIAVLACGFEGGWSALVGMAAQYNIALEKEEAQEIVRLFRASRPLMTSAWRNFIKCARAALDNPGRVFSVPNCQPTYFQKRGSHLFMRLPSNRELVYWDARIEPWTLPWGEVRDMPTCMWVNNGPKGNHRWERRAMRGGHFFQNAIQGECSDILKVAQHKLKLEGYSTVLTLHDEPLIQVPDTPDFTFEYFIQKFTEGAPWTEGLPIGADGWEGKRFKKA